MTHWVILAVGVTALSAANLPTAGEIVRKSVANTQADWKAAPKYDFTERDIVTKKGTTVKTYRVMMLDGSPYNKLIAQNGEPLSPAETSAEDSKLQKETAKRRHETPGQHQQRVAAYTRERRQDNALLQQMIDAMDYRLAGEDTVDGRRCFVLEGTPKAGYRPISRETKVLKGMRGKMWIDEQQYQWVKVEAEVFRPVEFGLFIAKVEPGTKFTLEQAPVRGGLWLPSHFTMQVKARVLYAWSHDSRDDETYSQYVPAKSQ